QEQCHSHCEDGLQRNDHAGEQECSFDCVAKTEVAGHALDWRQAPRPVGVLERQYQRLNHWPGEEDHQEEDCRSQENVRHQFAATCATNRRSGLNARPLAHTRRRRRYFTLHGPSLGGSGAQQEALVSSMMLCRVLACESSTVWMSSFLITMRWKV